MTLLSIAKTNWKQVYKMVRRDPETYILFATTGATVIAMGYWFGRSQGSAEKYRYAEPEGIKPWHDEHPDSIAFDKLHKESSK
ncbi:hypothetical protein V1514DRAFT_319787 [Lipomyces japonicus]|uniref:uncharacterized protein n=1 Tax=Lipomyces japonicus TaxID=56871 RepID=UPI0034CE9422